MRLVAVVLVFILGSSAHADDFFEAKVRPLLLTHCIGCHGAEKQKGGLRLDSKQGWQTGGDSGPAVVPGKPDMSLLVQAIKHSGALKMPAKQLPANDIAILVEWVQRGAVDPRTGDARLGGMTLAEAKKWWAYQPVKTPAVPANGAKNPVDAFLKAKHGDKLSFAPTTDRRTLIRRATYDLTGLPPTPAEVEAFVKDTSPEAFAKVVDRLLASPHYGERYGRHWLDLVRYADTAGENSDHPLPHAWRYRNWVIDAFNKDMPFDRFLQEQLAGDIMARDAVGEAYASAVTATGFLAIARRFGHDIDKDKHLTHEDAIDTIGKAFLGLSIGCARCHDHKYDAITAKDYYALYGILESTRFAFPGCEPVQQPRDLVPLMPPTEWARTVKPHQEQLANFDKLLAKLRGDHATNVKATQASAAKATKLLAKGEIADGGESPLKDIPEKIDVRAGEMLQLSVLPLKNHGADSTLLELEITEVGGQSRTWNLTRDVLDSFTKENPHAQGWCFFDARTGPLLLPELLTNHDGKTGLNVWRNGDTPSVFVNTHKEPHRVWTTLPARSFFLHPAPNGPVAVGWLCPFTGSVRVTGHIKDAHPGGPDGVGWQLDHVSADMTALLQEQRALVAKQRQLEKAKAELQQRAPKQDVAYAVMEAKATNVKLHLRGDPEKPGPEVPRRWLELFGGQLVPSDTGSGRLQLAQWIASKENPLTARVFVNRVWQYHFGKGLVPTPNDFGSRGLAPTHPELLDWLASEFMANGWQVKPLHRHIMLSQAYQQASTTNAETLKLDPHNERYTRFDARRLSAEELRDSLLCVSEKLDRTPGQAHPFPPENTWNFTQHNPFSTHYDTNRRSVYVVSLRNRRHPFLALFDGADPNATTPQRQVTTVPTQALYFLNDPFFHTQAATLAERVLVKPEAERLTALFALALQREPTQAERTTATNFLATYAKSLEGDDAKRTKTSWAALARLVLAGNEFLYLD